jgi:hypothetical protein
MYEYAVLTPADFSGKVRERPVENSSTADTFGPFSRLASPASPSSPAPAWALSVSSRPRQKVATAGSMLLVNENAGATAYLTIESLESVLESLGAKAQAAVNGATDIVIVADLTREKGWEETAKHAAVQAQVDAGERGKKGAVRLVRFGDFLSMSAALRAQCQQLSCIAEFGAGKAAPGPARTRGVCFGNTLQSSGESPRLNEKGKPSTVGFYSQFFGAS